MALAPTRITNQCTGTARRRANRGSSARSSGCRPVFFQSPARSATLDGDDGARMNLVRITVIDRSGGVSFVADAEALPAFAAACARGPGSIDELLTHAD